MTQIVRRAVAFLMTALIVILSTSGCAHQEEEVVDQKTKKFIGTLVQQAMERRIAAAIEQSEVGKKCRLDTDCYGQLMCQKGTCQYPVVTSDNSWSRLK